MSHDALRIPDSLDSYANKLAREDNVSLNQFIVMVLAEKVASLKTETFFRERAERANPEKALSILDCIDRRERGSPEMCRSDNSLSSQTSPYLL